MRKEINYVLYAWHEIKTGHNEVENSRSLMLLPEATESGRARRSRAQQQPRGGAVGAMVEGPLPLHLSWPSDALHASLAGLAPRASESSSDTASYLHPVPAPLLCRHCLEILQTL